MQPHCITPEAFWSNVEKTPACWVWTGYLNENGYGRIWKPKMYAHRVSWELTNGPIPAGLCVLHHCDNRRCVNPSHLFLGTRSDNSGDMTAKCRQKRGTDLPQTKLTEDQVREIRLLHAQGVSMSKLAIQFGMALMPIWALIRRRTWRHIP